MSVNRFFQFSHITYIFLLLGTYYALADPLNVISATAVGTLVLTSICMIGILAITPKFIEAPMGLLNLALLVMFQMRALILIIAPETAHYQNNAIADAGDYENAALILCIGTIMMAGGLLVGTALPGRRQLGHSAVRQPLLWPRYSPTVIFLGIAVVFFPAVVYAVLFDVLKVHYGQERTLGTIIVKLFPFLFPIDILFYLSLIVFVDRGWKELPLFAKLAALSIFVTFIFTKISVGSKSSIVEMMLYFLFSVYVVGKNIRLKAVTVIVIIPLLITLVTASFFVGLYMRINVVPEGVQSDRELTSQVTDFYESQIKVQQRQNAALDLLVRIGQRLTGFDVLVVVSDDKFKSPLAECNLLTEVKSFINMTFHLPDRFPIPMTGQVFGVVYDGATSEGYLEKLAYTTYVWYAWGIFFYHFGVFLGSIMLFLTAAFLGLIYVVLFNNKVGDTGVYLRLIWFMAFFYLLNTLGFDFSASLTVYYVLFGIFDMIVLRVIFQSLAYFSKPQRRAKMA